jgi:hypothetical protein
VSRGYDCILLYTKIGSDRKLRRLAPDQRWAFVAGVLSLAAQSPDRGRLLVAEGMPVTEEDIAEEAGVSIDVARSTLAKLRELGIVVTDEDGVQAPGKWETWQPRPRPSESREATRERQRRKRERDAAAAGQQELPVAAPTPNSLAAVDALCKLLADLVKKRDPKSRVNPSAKAWRQACVGLIGQGRTPGEIDAAIRFAMADDWECAQNLTMPKLARNFDRLVMKIGTAAPAAAAEPAIEVCPNGSTPSAAIDRWEAGLPELRAAMPDTTFDLWIEPLHAHRLDGDALVLGAPAGQHTSIRGRFGKLLQAAVGDFTVVACGGAA